MAANYRLLTVLLWFSLNLYAQDVVFPDDLRQHNLSKYNLSLFNPVFSTLSSENPNWATWGRFQSVETDNFPVSFFSNYNSRLGENSGYGLGVYQRSDLLFNTIGLVANYSRSFSLGRQSKITFGLNLIPINRSINRNRITSEAFNNLPEDIRRDNFIIKAMPGVNLTIGAFNVGVTSENLFDYNLSQSLFETDLDEKIVAGHMGYDIRLNDRGNSRLRLMSYIKSIPDFETQIGGNALFEGKNGWIQAGYNSFYGASAGIGRKFFESISLGVLTELPNAPEATLGPTFEVIFAWEFIGTVGRNGFAGPERKNKRASSIRKTAIKPLVTPVSPDKEAEEQLSKSVFDTDDHYSVIKRIDGVESGFYLVVNVYATQKYFNLFMSKLRKDGLNPKYFFNNQNKYYYVYLKRYETLEAIEKERASAFNGRYTDETWILWIQE